MRVSFWGGPFSTPAYSPNPAYGAAKPNEIVPLTHSTWKGRGLERRPPLYIIAIFIIIWHLAIPASNVRFIVLATWKYPGSFCNDHMIFNQIKYIIPPSPFYKRNISYDISFNILFLPSPFSESRTERAASLPSTTRFILTWDDNQSSLSSSSLLVIIVVTIIIIM